MSERWLGIVVGSEDAIVIDADVPDAGPIQINSDQTVPLQSGERAAAYNVIYQHISDYVRENGIHRIVIKGSAVPGITKLGHMQAAELRGVVAAAAASARPTEFALKASISRTFGKKTTIGEGKTKKVTSRNVDDYLADDAFWQTEIAGKSVRKGSREAAMIILAARKKK